MKRKHVYGLGVVIAAVIVGLLIGVAAGLFAGYSPPYKTVPAPPVPPGQTTPRCNVKPSPGHQAAKQLGMGSCLPNKSGVVKTGSLQFENAAAITATTYGPDLSNNDPFYGDSNWAAIGAKNAFVIVKVNQGTYYIDRTAKAMTDTARRHGLAVGGYDFADVCNAAPQAEAAVFVAAARGDNLVGGRGVLPLTGDMEYPTGSLSCNARSWINDWIFAVHSLTGEWPMIYTGAWWWDPHVGCWWPGYSISWVSGYTSTASVLANYMPCGLNHLDIHQYSDHGYNGAGYSDMSYWRLGSAVFAKATNVPTGPAASLVRKWIAERGASNAAFHRRGKHREPCILPVLTSGACGQLAWRVDHFQKLIDTAHGYYPHCFGKHTNLKAAECQIVRPAVAVWSNARSSTSRAEARLGCHAAQTGHPSRACTDLSRTFSYFDRRAHRTVVTSRY